LSDSLSLRKELKEKFLRDFDPAEKYFFLKKAKEAIFQKGYRASEDLFHYCYYLTLQERFRGISPDRDNGMLRFLLVEGKKEIEEAISLYEARLEETKLPLPDMNGQQFIEYFSE
jgi:hypothetical protein